MAAKKIAAGLYEYRGFKIEYIHEGRCWHISVIGEEIPCEGASSLREAKAFIGYWIEHGIIPS